MNNFRPDIPFPRETESIRNLPNQEVFLFLSIIFFFSITDKYYGEPYPGFLFVFGPIPSLREL